MIFSDLYTRVYDLLNFGKDYESEVNFLLEIWQRHSPTHCPKTVLDLGCGSGNHLRFFPSSVEKFGVDQSNQMLEVARAKNAATLFQNSKIADVQLSKQFELIYSLFHVLSYQSGNDDLKAMFNVISNHLAPSGIAVLDFWHRAAWDLDPPVTRVTKRISDDLTILRVSQPNLDRNAGSVSITIDLFVNENTQPPETFRHHCETHVMRGFLIDELQLAADEAGMQLIQVGPWMSIERELDPADWYGWIALKLR